MKKEKNKIKPRKEEFEIHDGVGVVVDAETKAVIREAGLREILIHILWEMRKQHETRKK